MRITRRRLASELAASAAFARAAAAQSASAPAAGPGPNEPHTGNLYAFIQRQADTAPALSFRRPEFRSLANWQKRARARLFDRLSYTPAPVKPEAELIRRTDHGDYTLESIRLRTTADVTVPAFVLILGPSRGRRRMGGRGSGDRFALFVGGHVEAGDARQRRIAQQMFGGTK